MTKQQFHKSTIRHRKNNQKLQYSENSEKPENNTKLKILKFQDNYHKPSLVQGLEQSYKVTSCNEKCNFFILLQNIIVIQFLFVGTGSPRPNLQYIIHVKNKKSYKSVIYDINSNILSKWTIKIFHIHTIQYQWMRKIEKDTKFMLFANSCHLKKISLNPV